MTPPHDDLFAQAEEALLASQRQDARLAEYALASDRLQTDMRALSCDTPSHPLATDMLEQQVRLAEMIDEMRTQTKQTRRRVHDMSVLATQWAMSSATPSAALQAIVEHNPFEPW